MTLDPAAGAPHPAAAHPAAALVVATLVARRRVALLAEGDAGAYARPLAARGAVSLAAQTETRLTVFAVARALGNWQALVEPEPPGPAGNAGNAGRRRATYVSTTRQALDPERLAIDHTLLVDATGMTTNLATASWQAFAPVLRRAPRVIMYVPRAAWPSALPLVELVTPLDGVVHLSVTEMWCTDMLP